MLTKSWFVHKTNVTATEIFGKEQHLMSTEKVLLSKPYNLKKGIEGAPDTRRYYSGDTGFGCVMVSNGDLLPEDDHILTAVFLDTPWYLADFAEGTKEEMTSILLDDEKVGDFIIRAIEGNR
jgi:hypothetical protein